MVIDPKHGLTSLNNPQSGKAQAAQRQPADPARPEKAAKQAAEQVQLSPEAKRLQRLEAAISEAPDTDTDRVAKLKAAIESGRYQVDAERLAEKILQSEGL